MNRCQQLYAPPHGSLEPCSGLPGQTCEFSCNKGYILTGSTTRTCNSDGTWTGTPTQCNGNWPQLLSFSSKMILGDGLWGWVFWDGCILERTWLVSSCHQLQSLYSLVFLSRQKKILSAFRFRVIPSLSLTSCGFKEKGSSETLASIPHCIFSSSRVKSPSFYCFEGIKLIFLSWGQSSSVYNRFSCSSRSSHFCTDSLFFLI